MINLLFIYLTYPDQPINISRDPFNEFRVLDQYLSIKGIINGAAQWQKLVWQ